MAKLTKGQITDRAREKYISMISDFLSDNGEVILRVGKNAISFPIVLGDGEERFIKLVVSVPRGSRLEGDEYNAFPRRRTINSIVKRMKKSVPPQKSNAKRTPHEGPQNRPNCARKRPPKKRQSGPAKADPSSGIICSTNKIS